MLYVKYISIKKIKGFKFPNESPFCFNKFVINLYFYCIAMYVFVICTLWNLLKLSLRTNISPFFCECSMYIIKVEISRNIHYCFVYVFYILMFRTLDLGFFLLFSNLLKLLIYCCLVLYYCYWEIWCQTAFLSFVSDLVILLGGPENFSFFFFFRSLTRICLEVGHSGPVLLDFCPFIFWV